MRNLVSIIIPLFNSREFIVETLESVLNQTFKNIEILVIDDASTDGSFEIAKTYESNKIKVVKNDGKGACAARNHGFSFSSGDYIQFLDADDILSPEKIQRQVEALNELQDAMAVCNTFHFKDKPENGICTDKPYLFSTEKPEELLLNLWGGRDLPLNMIQTSAWMTPRKLIEEGGLWNESLAKDQDGEFFARIGLKSSKIIFTPDIKNYYRKHINSNNIASKSKREHLESNLLATDLKKDYLFSKTTAPEAKKAVSTLYKQVAIDAWPKFKDISNNANSRCLELGGSNHDPVLGGRIIETLKLLFGWKTARTVSFYSRKLLNRL